MKVLPICVYSVVGIFSLISIIKVSGEVICSPNCQEAPVNESSLTCNETNVACTTCNVTTLECFYGCKEGYAGERCQFRCASNCSGCKVERCDENCNSTCNDTSCSQTEVCVEGCLNGFYGQNCSLTCPEHCFNSTCHRENGSCLLGCEREFFGETCNLSCSQNCKNGTKPICNETTLKCLHGCKTNYKGDTCDTCEQGQTGPQCNLVCDYNCQNCTWDPVTHETGCSLCRNEYYYFNRLCEQCSIGCKRNASSHIPTCDPINGICNFGCKIGWAAELCNKQCQLFCVNRTCARLTECCTEGCTNLNFGGCKCIDQCNSNCENGQCYQNTSCILGCKLNHWGFNCLKTCSSTCAAAPDKTTFTCDRDGSCLFGCNKTHWGTDCSKSCPDTCIERDCNSSYGHCLQGCKRGYWNERCDTNCSTNCLDSDCYDTNGNCKLGCLVGWYGPFCSMSCPVNCLNDTCIRESGTCALGCEKGFTGDNCSVQILPTEGPPQTDYVVIGATAGGAGFGFIVLIVVGLVLRNRYIAFKKELEMKKEDRKTRMEQNDLKEKRKNNRKSLALQVFNPHWNELPRRGSQTESEADDEAVLAVVDLLDHVMKTDDATFAEEFEDLIQNLNTTLQKGFGREKSRKLPPNVEKPERQKARVTSKGSKRVQFTAKSAASGYEDVAFENPVADVDNVIIENLDNEFIQRSYDASIIEVYSRKYIAAEGPTSSTSINFWLLAWSEGCPVIVMLTPTSIIKQSSSVRYWPELGKCEIYGNVEITNVKEDTYASYVSRELKVEKDKETRIIRQIQLSLWPDETKLPNIADFIDFYMHYRWITENDPMPVLVHCSDGEGRTGVYIAMDLLVRDGEHFGKLNVLDCVKSLREQRDNMVQNKKQYQFLYSLVAQTLQMRCRVICEKDFVETYKTNLEALEINPLTSAIEDSYENMRAAIVMKPVDEESIKRQWNLKTKNREGADIPEDQYRPALPGGVYINAVYIDNLRKRDIITTQMPLPKTVVDFYKLVVVEKCHVIVVLNNVTKEEKTTGVYWPVKGKTKFGDIRVTITDTAGSEDFEQMTLSLSDCSGTCCKRNMSETADHQVSLFHFKHWVSGQRPSDTVAMLRMIQAVKNEREEYESGPLIVHCLNGSERSGVFCALYELTDAIEKGIAFSPINTAYKIKYRRPSAILNLDQFKFIHEALEIFITGEMFRGVSTKEINPYDEPMIQADDDV